MKETFKETFSKVYKFLWGWAVLEKNAASPTPETEYQRQKEGFDKTYKPETIDTPLKKILAVFYPLVLILTVVISFCLMVTKPFFTSLEKISWRFWDFVRYTSVMMIVTLPFWFWWGILMMNYDPRYPAWNFFPWTVTGISFLGQTLEDWLFYPVSILLACVLFVYWEPWNQKDSKSKSKIPLDILIGVYVAASCFFFTVDLLSRSLVLLFSTQILILYPLVRDRLSFIPTLTWLTLLTIYGSAWDHFAVNLFGVWLADALGTHWAQSWNYVTIFPDGTILQSKAIASYVTKPWAWIGRVAISTSPWLSIVGSFHALVMSEAIRKYLVKPRC